MEIILQGQHNSEEAVQSLEGVLRLFKERYHITGLIDMRVDMIVISVLLIDFILKELHLTHMRVSTFSLKEGVISRKLGLKLF